MATDFTKTVKLKMDSSDITTKISNIQKMYDRLNDHRTKYARELKQQLANAYEQQMKINKAIADENKSIQNRLNLEKRLLDLQKQNMAARRNVAQNRQQQNFDNFRRGLDIGGGLSKFASQPFGFLTGKFQSAGNKQFDDFIKGNQMEMQGNQSIIDNNNTRLAELAKKEASGKKLSKNEKAERDELTNANKNLEGKNAQLKNANAKAAVAQAAMNTVANGLKTLAKPLNDFKDGVVQAVKAMINMKTGVATYSSSSLITNSSARETKLKYGMNDSQAYGFTQAKSLLNIQSDEDLMYMNQEQRDRLLGYMEKYSNWYSEMESSGVLQNIQEMQLEFEMFKQEIAMEFLQWVSENKETIMTCIKGIFNFIKGIATLVMNIINILSWGTADTSSAFESDSWNSGATTNNNQKTNNININANVTNNGLSGSSGIDTANDQMWSDLAKQIVTATE